MSDMEIMNTLSRLITVFGEDESNVLLENTNLEGFYLRIKSKINILGVLSKGLAQTINVLDECTNDFARKTSDRDTKTSFQWMDQEVNSSNILYFNNLNLLKLEEKNLFIQKKQEVDIMIALMELKIENAYLDDFESSYIIDRNDLFKQLLVARASLVHHKDAVRKYASLYNIEIDKKLYNSRGIFMDQNQRDGENISIIESKNAKDDIDAFCHSDKLETISNEQIEVMVMKILDPGLFNNKFTKDVDSSLKM